MIKKADWLRLLVIVIGFLGFNATHALSRQKLSSSQWRPSLPTKQGISKAVTSINKKKAGAVLLALIAIGYDVKTSKSAANDYFFLLFKNDIVEQLFNDNKEEKYENVDDYFFLDKSNPNHPCFLSNINFISLMLNKRYDYKEISKLTKNESLTKQFIDDFVFKNSFPFYQFVDTSKKIVVDMTDCSVEDKNKIFFGVIKRDDGSFFGRNLLGKLYTIKNKQILYQKSKAYKIKKALFLLRTYFMGDDYKQNFIKRILYQNLFDRYEKWKSDY